MNPASFRKVEGFSILPPEVSKLIMDFMDLQTLFNTSHSFAGNSYEIGNQVAGSILKNKFIKLDPKKNNLHLLSDYLYDSREILATIYNWTTTDNFIDDLNKLEIETKNHPSILNEEANDNTLYGLDIKNVMLRCLLNAGAKIDNLADFLYFRFSEQTIRQILSLNSFKNTIFFSHIYASFLNQYPIDITNSLLDKMRDNSDCKFDIEKIFTLFCQTELPEPTKVKIVQKIYLLPVKEIYHLVTIEDTNPNFSSKGILHSESLIMALLEKIDLSTIQKETVFLSCLTKKIWKETITNNRFSFEPLKKIINIHTLAKILFNVVYFENDLRSQNSKFYQDESLFSALIPNKPNIPVYILDNALKNNFPPKLVFKIYRALKLNSSFQNNCQNLSVQVKALNYMFSSKDFQVIYDLRELGESPLSDNIVNAIKENHGEYLIDLLLEAYGDKERRKGGMGAHHYAYYTKFLDFALKYQLSHRIIEKILNKTLEIWESSLEYGIQNCLPDDLIEKLRHSKRV